MTDHIRTSIRKKITDILKNKTDAGESVFASRIRPVEQNTLPRIHVYAQKEPVSLYQESPREYERLLEIAVEIQAEAKEDLDDVLDDISLQVENVLCQDYTLGGICGDVTLTDSELFLNQDGDTLIGACILTYNVRYFTYAVSDPAYEENHISDLKTVNVTFLNSSENKLSEDKIDLPSE